MSENQAMDDEKGNCKRCGHPFKPHLVVAFDTSDYSKGGLIKCQVEGCDCKYDLTFNLAKE